MALLIEDLELHHRHLEIDFHSEKLKLHRPFSLCVGSGRAALGLRKDYQSQLAIAHKECGFKYLRFHGLLCDDMQLLRGVSGDTLDLNFEKVDQLISAILNTGMKPFIELGFMPEALKSGDQTIFWWKGNVTPPRSYSLWHELVFQLTQHFIQRFGQKEVRSWYFEVWNEPDLPNFFTGTMQDYFELYRSAVQAIKLADSELRVGGPATSEHRWISELLEFCRQTGTPIDFISTHGYCVEGMLDEVGNRFLTLVEGESQFVDGVTKTHQTAKSHWNKPLEIHYTEWSVSYSSRDPVHDHIFSGPYLADRIFDCRNLCSSLSYWTFSDIFEELGPPDQAFHGGFGLLSIDSIRKPAFFLFKYLNNLKEFELPESSKGSWLSADQNGNMTFVLWKPYEYLGQHANQILFRKLNEPKVEEQIKVAIKNLPYKDYNLQIHRVGYRVNDAYSQYIEWQMPARLTADQLTKLQGNTRDEVQESACLSKNTRGLIEFDTFIREGDVMLVGISRE